MRCTGRDPADVAASARIYGLGMSRRGLASLLGAVAALFVMSAPALAASLSDEVAAGQQVATKVQTGKTSCSSLSDSDFEVLGESVMDRMVGSRAAHQTMNQRMTQAVGSQSTDRMHQTIGRRFAGCTSTSNSTTNSGDWNGSWMMGGDESMMGDGSWNMMDSPSDWAWMTNGNWQHMNSSDWRQAAASMMGTRNTGRSGWSTPAVLAAVVAALAIGALAAIVVMRRRHRTPPPTATTTGSPPA